MITRGAILVSRVAVFFSVLFVFTACGGGGGGSGFYAGTDNEQTLSVALLNALGEKITTVSPGAPATVRAKFNKNGDNVLVSASTTVGQLLPSTGSALTNGDGMAFFTLQIPPGTPKGGGVVTVSGEGLNASVDFEVGESDLHLGYFDDKGEFIEGEIGIAPSTTLSALGRAQLSVAVLNSDYELVDEPEDVIFTSPCLASGLASIDPVSPITTINGQVDTVYAPAGCSGTDEITATVAGASGQALGLVEVAPPEASGVQFVSANPTSISIKGTGGFSGRPESSDVAFKVVSSNGLPIQGAQVNFSLSSTSSGASLSETSGVTASSGQVFTSVSSGELGGVIGVIATVELENGAQVSTISDPITISSGLPVQNNVSLSVDSGQGFVVENGMTQDGVERTLTVTMLDYFNKPVPNGTQARFETEYGFIDSSCLTGQQNGARVPTDTTPNAGQCSVLWTSSNPREPASAENKAAVKTTLGGSSYNCSGLSSSSGPCPNDLGYTRGGRSTILVYGLGEMSFQDSDNSGIMEPDESDDYENLPEAFLDKNEDGVYTPKLCSSGGGTTAQCRAGSEETYIDLNVNGQYDLNNNPAQYHGFACPPSGDGVYCVRKPVNVRADTVLILSAPDLSSPLWGINLAAGSAVVTTVNQQGGSYTAYIADLYNNRPPAGSTVTVSGGGGCRVSSQTSFTVGDSANPGAFAIPVQVAPALVGPENPGSINITVNPLDGAEASRSYNCPSACLGEASDPDFCPDACDPVNIVGDPPASCLAECTSPEPAYCLDLCVGGMDDPVWCP